MKENQLKEVVPVKNMLQEQESMKVVLNGGNYQLDDATIPFRIGFSQEVADKKPSHILVLDVTIAFDRNGIRHESDNISERSLFKMEPVQYLQLKEPGEHHLIFILLNDMDNKKRQHLLEKQYAGYENKLYFESIQSLELNDQVAYCEAIISVPEEFFAKKPETAFGKAIWSWTNAWYRLKPVDQCEYRKRKIVAFTIKPILWVIGLLLRLLIASVYTAFSFVVRCLGLIFGYQAVSFFPNFRKTWWEFLVIYSRTEFEDFLEKDYWFGDVLKNTERNLNFRSSEDWYPQKTLFFFGKQVHYPISLFALFAYAVGFGIYLWLLHDAYFTQEINSFGICLIYLVSVAVVSILIAAGISMKLLPTISGKQKWINAWSSYNSDGEKRMDACRNWIFYLLLSLGVLALIVPKIRLINLSKMATPTVVSPALIIGVSVMVAFIAILIIRKLFVRQSEKVEEDLVEKLSAKELRKLAVIEKQANWLKTGFDINNMPDKIDFKTMPEPSVATHKLVIAFWRTKANVCKPYAKK